MSRGHESDTNEVVSVTFDTTSFLFDEGLRMLLQNKVWRSKLRDYIIEHKLTDDNRFGKIAAEGLGVIAALLLAAKSMILEQVKCDGMMKQMIIKSLRNFFLS